MIRDLEKQIDDRGRPYYTAVLVIPVDNRFGSWDADVDGYRRPVLREVAADLQAEVKSMTKREAKDQA